MSRPRRSHAERTAETRGRILRAVVESIAEVGYQRTTATEIARRSGVTWGAVQHHFGGKGGILRAVLQDSFEHFAALIADVPVDGTSVETRVSTFVDRAWDHFRSDRYRSAFEILVNHAGREDDDPDRDWRGEMFRAWGRVWSSLFGDLGLTRAHSVRLQHYTISVLSGLATMQMLEGRRARLRSSELELLKQTLVRELSGRPGGVRRS